MRLGCITVDHLAVQVERRKHPRLLRKPLVIGGKPWDKGEVMDCCREAESLGINPGMSLRQAEQLCPWANFLQPDHESYDRDQLDLRDALLGLTPLVEMGELGLGYAEISGLHRLYGPETLMADTMAVVVKTATGLEGTVGVASNKFTAHLAASTAGAAGTLVVPAGHEADFLADFPLWYLPCEEEDWVCFHRLGVYTFGELVKLGRAAVIRRFGRRFGRIYDLARGIDPSRLVPERVTPSIEERTSFDEGAVDRSQLLNALQVLAEKAVNRLREFRRLCGGLRVAVATVSGAIIGKSLHLKSPTSSLQRILRLARDGVRSLDLREAIEEVILTLFPLPGIEEGAKQAELFDVKGRHRAMVERTAASLRERWGKEVLRPASGIPPPEPVRIEAEVDDQECPRVLAWGGQARTVIAIIEHWRVASEWWRREMVRHYFRVILAGQQVVTVFRDAGAGGWYLERRHLSM